MGAGLTDSLAMAKKVEDPARFVYGLPHPRYADQ